MKQHWQSWKKKLSYLLPLGVFILVFPFLMISYLNTISPDGIVIHHTAVPLRLDGSEIDANYIDGIHQSRGFRTFYWGRFYHIGYHYLILPDGRVQHGRPDHCIGAHTRGYNKYLGICLVGDFSSSDNPNGERGLTEPTKEQMQALTELVTSLQNQYEITQNRILLHRELDRATECPGDRFRFSELRERFKGN
jgi:hypothetical protein